jgi:hypothetical protein
MKNDLNSSFSNNFLAYRNFVSFEGQGTIGLSMSPLDAASISGILTSQRPPIFASKPRFYSPE